MPNYDEFSDGGGGGEYHYHGLEMLSTPNCGGAKLYTFSVTDFKSVMVGM